MKKNISKNIKTVLNILQDEVYGDVAAALSKITKDYTMTWVDTGLMENSFSRQRKEISKKNLKKYIRYGVGNMILKTSSKVIMW